MFKSGFAWICSVLVVGGLVGLAKSTPKMGARLAKTAVPRTSVVSTAPALNELRLGSRAKHVSPDDVSALPKSELSLTDEAARTTDETAEPKKPSFGERATQKALEEAITNVDKVADLVEDPEARKRRREYEAEALRRAYENADPQFRHFLHPPIRELTSFRERFS